VSLKVIPKKWNSASQFSIKMRAWALPSRSAQRRRAVDGQIRQLRFAPRSELDLSVCKLEGASPVTLKRGLPFTAEVPTDLPVEALTTNELVINQTARMLGPTDPTNCSWPLTR